MILEWQTIPIREVYAGMFDGPHATPKPSESGPIFLGIKNVGKSGQLDLSDVRHISEEEYPRWIKRVEPRYGDIVFSYEATLNRYAMIPKGFRGCLGRRMALIRPDESKAYGRFLYYYFFGQEWRNVIAQNTLIGSTVDRIPIAKFPDFPITIPPLPIQRKIAAILSAYDDLIENNLRRIKILEETAQTLYRGWFGKFRFPGHRKVKMVNSPLGKIPEGWEVTTLNDVLATLESGLRPKGGIDPEARGVPSIGAENIIGLGRYDYSKEKFVTREFFDNMNRGHIQSGDVLLYKDGAQIGRKSMFRDGFPHAECCINEHVFIMRTNGRCSQNYLFFWLDQPEMTQNIINLNANAAQPGINQSGVRGLPILLPPAPLLEKAEQVLDPTFGALFSHAKKNNILHQTRDLLLPKLISGKLDVSKMDITIPEAEV